MSTLNPTYGTKKGMASSDANAASWTVEQVAGWFVSRCAVSTQTDWRELAVNHAIDGAKLLTLGEKELMDFEEEYYEVCFGKAEQQP